MRVGLLTFHCAPSYGAVLQAYGLYRMVELLGHDPVIVDYVPQWRRALYVPGWKAFMTLRPWACYYRLRQWIVRRATTSFVRGHMRLSAPYSHVEQLRASPPQCTAFVTGSDQVWNPRDFEQTGTIDRGYFLDFPPIGARRIAYAPSCGMAMLPRAYMEAIRPFLSAFSSMAMREQSTADYLSEEMRRRIPCVCDPTILAPREVYDALQSSSRRRGLVCFFLNDYSDRRSAYQIMRGLSGSRGAFLTPAFSRLLNGVSDFSVEGWVSTFAGAEFVLTDSFHGTVFAILYKKPFITVAGGLGARIERITSLLEKLNLKDRLLTGDVTRESVGRIFRKAVDWKDVGDRLQEWRQNSLVYLKEALHVDV